MEVEPPVATRFLQDGAKLWLRLPCIPDTLDDGFYFEFESRR
jgi:hypothetical protein